jgi:uncharacterized coiled-coil protein SlyX
MLYSLLEERGIKIESLNALERETLQKWDKQLSQNQLTVTGVADHVKSLIEAVEKELTELRESASFWTFLFSFKRDIFLKARLKNYLMLHDFLTAPDKARKHIEQALENVKK